MKLDGKMQLYVPKTSSLIDKFLQTSLILKQEVTVGV
jgi:hypothetical protein